MVGEQTAAGGLSAVPRVLVDIAVSDYGRIRYDLALLLVLLVCIGSVLARHRSELSKLAAGTYLVTLALNVLVVEPSYFRYFMPVYPVLLLAALTLVAGPPGAEVPATRRVQPGLHHPSGADAPGLGARSSDRMQPPDDRVSAGVGAAPDGSPSPSSCDRRGAGSA